MEVARNCKLGAISVHSAEAREDHTVSQRGGCAGEGFGDDTPKLCPTCTTFEGVGMWDVASAESLPSRSSVVSVASTTVSGPSC